jgi:hypothetical protein
MFHDPRSDRHVGRHGRTRRSPDAPPRRPVVIDNKVIPPPPRRFDAGPLVRGAAGEPALVAICWEALCATNPAGLTGPAARAEARYRKVARVLAGRLERSLRRNTAAVRAELDAALIDEFGASALLRGRVRRAQRWIDGEWRRR